MRGVSKGVQSAVLFTLLTLLLADGAAAKGLREERGWRQQFARAKRFIVTVLGRFSTPPGEPVQDPAQIVPSESTPTTEG